MKFLLLSLVLPLYLFCASSFAELYRCIDASGDTIFSDSSCGPNSQTYQSKQTMALKLKTIKSLKSPVKIKKRNSQSSSNKIATCKTFTSTQLRNLRVKEKFEKGMPASAIQKRFGKANEIITSNNKQTWFYKGDRLNRTFKFKNTCLTSWKEKWTGKKSKLSKYLNWTFWV